MEEFLSQKGVSFELRDLMVEPLSPDELWRLMHDAAGRQLGPLTRVGKGVVMGYDPIRLDENLADNPDARTSGVTVYGRPGDRGTEGVLTHLRGQNVPATLVDLDQTPFSREALWQFLEIPNANIRTPFTDVDGTVVLGNDRQRLDEVLGGRV